MPRIGLPGGRALAERVVEPAAAQSPPSRSAAEPTPGQDREIGVAHGVGVSAIAAVAPSRANASCTERTLPAP